ncbi:hypothetical protein D3C73_1244660 [compost metagenome]
MTSFLALGKLDTEDGLTSGAPPWTVSEEVALSFSGRGVLVFVEVWLISISLENLFEIEYVFVFLGKFLGR